MLIYVKFFEKSLRKKLVLQMLRSKKSIEDKSPARKDIRLFMLAP